jgi:hypothetical protein
MAAADTAARRACILAFGLIVVGAVAVMLYLSGPSAPWLPGCLFHRFTGWLCPGCGMTRAAHAALHGDPGAAFRFNPLGMVLLPAALVGIGLELLGWVRGKPLPLRFRVGGRWAWAVFGVLVVFWVLRNIPAWPFVLLAPP